MKLKRLVAGAAIAGGLGVGALGLGAGTAAADPPHQGSGPGWVQPQPPGARGPMSGGRTATVTTAPSATTDRSSTRATG